MMNNTTSPECPSIPWSTTPGCFFLIMNDELPAGSCASNSKNDQPLCKIGIKMSILFKLMLVFFSNDNKRLLYTGFKHFGGAYGAFKRLDHLRAAVLFFEKTPITHALFELKYPYL